MQKEVVEMRKELNMTQEEFSHLMGVTQATVNSWEAERSEPNRGRCLFLLEELLNQVNDKELLKKRLLLISSVTDLNPILVVSGARSGEHKIEDLIKEDIDEVFEEDFSIDLETEDLWRILGE